jgi:hypothetical protein
MSVDMVLAGVLTFFAGILGMTLCHMGVVPAFFMIAGFMVFGRFTVMCRSGLVMFRGGFVMRCTLMGRSHRIRLLGTPDPPSAVIVNTLSNGSVSARPDPGLQHMHFESIDALTRGIDS